jgi:hypothetical protein
VAAAAYFVATGMPQRALDLLDLEVGSRNYRDSRTARWELAPSPHI